MSVTITDPFDIKPQPSAKFIPSPYVDQVVPEGGLKLAEIKVTPELIYLKPTKNVPNSARPCLVYRNVLQLPVDREKLKHHLVRNKWRPEGFVGAFYMKHYHPNVHECYAIVQGTTTFLLGVGEGDEESEGYKLELNPGDVYIQPAGTAHATYEASEDLSYLASYPIESVHWEVNRGWESEEEKKDLFKGAYGVPIPNADPVYGPFGDLLLYWASVRPIRIE